MASLEDDPIASSVRVSQCDFGWKVLLGILQCCSFSELNFTFSRSSPAHEDMPRYLYSYHLHRGLCRVSQLKFPESLVRVVLVNMLSLRRSIHFLTLAKNRALLTFATAPSAENHRPGCSHSAADSPQGAELNCSPHVMSINPELILPGTSYGIRGSYQRTN